MFAEGQPARPTVIAVDLDRFKQVNDSVGIAVGDSILLTLARRLDAPPQAAGHAGARLGRPVRPDPLRAGSGRASPLSPTRSAARGAPIAFDEREIASPPRSASRSSDAQTPRRGHHEGRRDSRWHAKRAGGDRIELFRPAMRAHKSRSLALESDMKRALERSEIRVFFQPIVRLEDRTIAGFEALVRWDHPRLGRLSPAEFIPSPRRPA
jgi:predicted signal transduction protein with EAL and GGDEF domain